MGLRDRIFRELVPVDTTAGPVELPIRYWDVSMGTAFFRADGEAAMRLVEGLGLVPVSFRGGALASLVFFEYRGSSIGPYNEVGLGVLSKPAGGRRTPGAIDPFLPTALRTSGFAILDLPVSTPIADAGGREIWGYPKFVTELPMKFADDAFDGEVRDPDGAVVCALRGNLGGGVRMPVRDLVTFTRLHGERWRTEITTRGHSTAHRGLGLRLEVGTSDHAMRGRLHELGLAGTSPTVFLVSHDFRSLLHAGAAC